MRVPILITGNGKVPCEHIVHAVLLAMPRINAASVRPMVAGTAFSRTESGVSSRSIWSAVFDRVFCLVMLACLLPGHFASAPRSVPRLQESCPALSRRTRFSKVRTEFGGFAEASHPTDAHQTSQKGLSSPSDTRLAALAGSKTEDWPKVVDCLGLENQATDSGRLRRSCLGTSLAGTADEKR